jgi:Mg-chelatase subunit ChlD
MLPAHLGGVADMAHVEVVFSFDTTGSMYPCLTQVRKKVKTSVKRLFNDLKGIKIGVIAHGDYCDKKIYVTKHLPLGDKLEPIVKFVETVKATGGGDYPEAYELVLNEARDLKWTPAAKKILVMIGDAIPHTPKQNPRKLDWKKEAKALGSDGVRIYAVQALGRSDATSFYKDMAKLSGGSYLALDQFSSITDLVMAIAYSTDSDVSKIAAYEDEVKKAGRMSRSLTAAFDTLRNRKSKPATTARNLSAVAPGRFQVLDVDKDMPIQQFCKSEGLSFKPGRGFYEFTKTETIQGYKEVVLMQKDTGDLFEGNKARSMIGLKPDVTDRLKATALDKYAVFVQSTSNNRKLMGGTRFLYEVEDWA